MVKQVNKTRAKWSIGGLSIGTVPLLFSTYVWPWVTKIDECVNNAVSNQAVIERIDKKLEGLSTDVVVIDDPTDLTPMQELIDNLTHEQKELLKRQNRTETQTRDLNRRFDNAKKDLVKYLRQRGFNEDWMNGS